MLRAFLLCAVAFAQEALECPCITSASAQYSTVQSQLVIAGYPASYGLNGCGAYDDNLTAGCTGATRESWCANPWCYVDMTLCPVNEELCTAAGGTIGGDQSPHCRDRPYKQSSIVNASLFYSYETCGSVNTYDMSRLTEQVAGRAMRYAIDAYAPWVLLKTNAMGAQVYGGAIYDFFQSTLTLFTPMPTANHVDGWATAASRAKFPGSSYTACVHDVAVGNFDICVADLWITPFRNQLTTFLPALRQDYFYLVVPTKVEEVTFWTRLVRPFSPFAAEAWLGIAAFLLGMSFILWIMQIRMQPECCSGGVREVGTEFGRSCFTIWHDFLLGQSSAPVERGPGVRLVSFGFAFFVLVTLASYTASLASLLVVQRSAVGTIANIDEAIERQVKICVPGVLYDTFQNVFPRAKWVNAGLLEHLPRQLYSGTCQAIIASQDTVDNMHAGKIEELDCAAVADGSLTEAEGHCEKGFGNTARNDCDLLRVGDLLWSVPVSFPVSDRISHSMAWAFTFAIQSGMMNNAIKVNQDAFAQPACAVETRSVADGLQLEDLSGMIMISILVVGIGFLVFAAESSCFRKPGEWDPEGPAPAAQSEGAQQAVEQDEGEAKGVNVTPANTTAAYKPEGHNQQSGDAFVSKV